MSHFSGCGTPAFAGDQVQEESSFRRDAADQAAGDEARLGFGGDEEIGDPALREPGDDFAERIIVHLHRRGVPPPPGADILPHLDPGDVGARPIEPAPAAAIGAQRDVEVEATARRDPVDQRVENAQAAADGNMLEHEVAVDEVERAFSLGQRIVGMREADIGGAGGGGIGGGFGEHRGGDVEREDLRKLGGERQAQPPDPAAMIERAMARDGAEVLLELGEEAGDISAAGGEKFLAAAPDPRGGEALIGEHAKIRIVPTPLPPRFVGAQHGAVSAEWGGKRNPLRRASQTSRT